MTAKTFSDLELEEILIQNLQTQNIHTPTVIQAQTIPVALEGKDILGSAPTGTGKTLAFLIPAVQHILDFPRRKPGPPRILILTPTRELAMQIAEQAKLLTQSTHLSIATITGGVAYMNHAEVFSKNQDIVIATTGRLLQYIKEENFDCRAVEMLILDEADRMLDMGFSQDVETISAETRWRKQTLLFSATLEGKGLHSFANRILNEPIEINADPSRKERKKILQFYYRSDNLEHKEALLIHLLKQEDFKKTIIFVRKRERVHELVSVLHQAGIHSCYLEGEMVQAKRNEAIKRMNNNTVNVLVATDVAARGIDIDDVTHVINFDAPKTADVYLHRIGRTARAGKKGTAIMLIEAHDYELLQKIERYIKEPIKLRTIDELRPKTKTPKSATKKKPSQKAKLKSTAKKEDNKKKKIKLRHRDTKNKGKPKKLINTTE
ncbi:ATP-dependent RNA helicase SrmB [Gilliamella sp. B2776]|uniref:ATP-dependent RNA helicase SrmB n=1 Tax=unclassified Gilliamella TaxID=2685620 RepID=UPI002269FED0|nr:MULTISPECIES: ATP-dependent RNA helicase SrmB [unclassified Gilliamella]MCX8650003.1 ATP-dependent RNA helicase SrmB [Gilliamella sp. B2779]MCX8654936.1 ATP-dependent RNA helicase SrmB [Gilliamella sp. B2737]MCX8691776.1 ATP-dependent RNA helicase SrmB [Gilliamella sp. B2776]MCX8702983.1 ATP-dependent RNA helicase SrmB [Gilliamella sp. B2781]WDM18399.1 ATP-dependent RNA helicase SrmB [Gilliamella sp. B3022]